MAVLVAPWSAECLADSATRPAQERDDDRPLIVLSWATISPVVRSFMFSPPTHKTVPTLGRSVWDQPGLHLQHSLNR